MSADDRAPLTLDPAQQEAALSALSPVDRRDFLKIAATLSAYGAVSLAGGVGAGILFEPFEADAQAATPTIVVGTNPSPARLVDMVLEPLGGMKRFVKPGAKVVIKPNIGWDRTPEQAANTHPEVVKRVAELALAAGAASVLVVDRPCNDARRCYENSGIQPILMAMGDKRIRVEHMDKRLYVDTKIARGKSIQSWEFYKPILTADTFINIPVAKHHSAARLTMCMKNMMGPVGGSRGNLHVSLHQRIADLNVIYRPHLHILDATRILMANGPQGGNLKDVKVLNQMAAGTDPVAIDAWGTSLFGLKPSDVPHIARGFELGLGQMDLSKVKIIKV